MQNNDNQTNQKDPHNRGQNGFEYISPGLCSIWLGRWDSNPPLSDDWYTRRPKETPSPIKLRRIL